MEPPDEYCLSSDRFAAQGIEIVPGEKSNSEWLVLNDLYILHKSRSFKNGNVVWECKHRRGMGCPFRMETGISNEEIEILLMYKPALHKCAQNPCEIYVHKFKNEVKKMMMNDFRAKYATAYNATKKTFLDRIPNEAFRELVSFELPSVVSVFLNTCFVLYLILCIAIHICTLFRMPFARKEIVAERYLLHQKIWLTQTLG